MDAVSEHENDLVQYLLAQYLLAEYLEGCPVETLADLDGEIELLLDGQYPGMREECVHGPEDVIRDGATEHLRGLRARVSDD